MFKEYAVDVILSDLEGTTTSINFVKDVLFPYAKNHAELYLTETWSTETTQLIVKDLKELAEYRLFNENISTSGNEIKDMANFVHYLIDKDLKLGPLKALQGHIWSKGYENGTIKGHFYADVPEALKRWKENGIKVAIYSSGSVKAQKLLFRYAESGDLSGYISDYFDTSSGYKQIPQSYRNIVESLQVKEPGKILFLTDVIKEAEAAEEAGLLVAVLQRPGNAQISSEECEKFHILHDFYDIKIRSK